MAAFRTLWTAIVGLYDETLVLVIGNLAAVALNLPIGLALFLIGLPFAGAGSDDGGGGAQLLLVTIAWLMPFLPTPGNVALGGLAYVAAGPDAPRFSVFRASLRTHWRLALRCLPVSLVILVALVANLYFYVVFSTGWLRFISILWLYGAFFWLSLHIYLVPLMVHVAEPRLIDLYRRAAFVALGHPAYTFVLLVALLVVGFLSVVFVPVYALLGTAFISLVQAHALREIRRRHGDLLSEEPEEEVIRL
jgi:uncharacterized membrane protein YesL